MKNKRKMIICMVGIFLICIMIFENRNTLLSKVFRKKDYTAVEDKEKIEQQIDNLRQEQEKKGEKLKITDLPKINNEEIDVRSVQQFPVKVLCNGHRFEIDSNFNVNYIEDTDETIVTYTTEPKGYTNQDNVQILIMINNSKGIKSIQKPESNNIIYVYGKNKVVIDYDVVSNGTYIFKVTDVDGKEISKDVVIDQIDKIEPKSVEIECKPGIRATTIEINAKDSDKIDNSTKSGIDKYEIFLNNQKIGETSENRYRITNLNKNIEYSAYVIAYDKAGNFKQSEMAYFTIPEGEYPTITENTIVFPDEDMLAIDAICPATFDNNQKTYGDYTTDKYLTAKAIIDKSAWGQILKVNFNIWNNGSSIDSRALTMYCYDENQNLIGYVTSNNCTTATDYDYNFEIPDGCKSIKFINDLNFRIYEINIKKNDEINNTTYRNLIPTVTTPTTIKNGVIISVSDFYGHEYGAIEAGSAWSTASGNFNEHWLMVHFLEPKTIDKYELTGMHSWGAVPSFYLQASNDKTNWINLENQLHAGVWGHTPQNYSIQIDNTTAYKYYRIYIPSGSGWVYGDSGAIYIYNLKMYGK